MKTIKKQDFIDALAQLYGGNPHQWLKILDKKWEELPDRFFEENQS